MEEAFNEGKYYYEATLILERKKLFPPIVTNVIFACELFSKAILYKGADNVKGHGIKNI